MVLTIRMLAAAGDVPPPPVDPVTGILLTIAFVSVLMLPAGWLLYRLRRSQRGLNPAGGRGYDGRYGGGGHWRGGGGSGGGGLGGGFSGGGGATGSW